MSRRVRMSAQVRLDEDHGYVFAPEIRINDSDPADPFGVLDICDGLCLTSHDPEIFDRLAAFALALAADLRAARQIGGTS